MLVISCHADTGFSAHALERSENGVVYGHLDNFAGVYCVMNAYFSGHWCYDYLRIELTYGEEVDFAGAYEVCNSLHWYDLILVVDVTATPTEKDFVIEKCRNRNLQIFLSRSLRNFSFDLYDDCPDPISNVDEVDVYTQKCPYVCFLGIPCWGGDYNQGMVFCRQESLQRISEAICQIAKDFPHFCQRFQIPLK